ncbi:hypothetical protein BCR34DRAFT_574839 [Clohesyomyces aquaticus]|uniref:F-box domain-containing protein n=1 Tax=Clohesyomyces aquaticus TaxID=1231657 RepID=A0A1Y1YU31_9PLEO|nr:hypothetical protein BCR34DRAFT_574839 [Clohesyomyces aquaticus]
MARSLKRKRAAVSYREPSSELELSADSGQEGASRRRPTAPQRRSTRHQHQDDDQEDDQEQAQVQLSLPRRTAPRERELRKNEPKNARLRGKRAVVYKESTSEDSDEQDAEEDQDEDFEAEEATAPQERTRAKTAVGRSRRAHHKRPKRSTVGGPLKPRKAVKAKMEPTDLQLLGDGKIPNWSSLPYHILLQIFVYASHPLHDDNMFPLPSIQWLALVARRCCNAFTKPALTALYRNPPIFAIKQNRKDLVHHLISPPSTTHSDYSVMVKRLELDATKMSQLTDPTHSVNDLAALITSLKAIKEIDIFDPWDKPPFQPRSRGRRWNYPNELFIALRASELHLKSWRWHGAFLNHQPIKMKEIHTDKAFVTLREVILTRFDLPKTPSKVTPPGQASTEELLCSALAVLPSLRSLSFESCGVLNERLLSMLPNHLTSFSVTNCEELTSEALEAFLVTGGARLEELILNHNRSLDLSFMADLKHSCPRLEVLKMDLNYYTHWAITHDQAPNYAELLKEGEIPSWPSALRVIDLEFLRNWTPGVATAFFTSIIDSAEQLPWLRELRISAMVDNDWRARAEYRSKWTARFQRVFGKKISMPSAHLVSLRAFREWKARAASSAGMVEEGEAEKTSVLNTAIQSENEVEGRVNHTDSTPESSKNTKGNETWGSKRLRTRAKNTPIHDESSGDESSSDHESNEGSDSEEIGFIQGKCHTVVFVIDNLRPRDNILHEDDFLDTEPSGDEDWNGEDPADDAVVLL